MLFAKGVVFVEGIAEQLIIPAIAERNQLPFDQAHVAVVRVDGLTFRHFLPLFGIGSSVTHKDQYLKRRVVCIVDGDPCRKEKKKNSRWKACYPFQLDTKKSMYEYRHQSPTASSLLTSTDRHPYVRVFVAEKTLEYDLALTNSYRKQFISESMKNRSALIEFTDDQTKKIDSIKHLLDADQLDDLETVLDQAERLRLTYATAYLKFAADCKGEHAFAIEQIIRSSDQDFDCPPYIKDAIEWATATGVAQT
ncbi:ATP-dependent endonuclease [Novipirellula sp. SH528]|uniref:ATP-dependent endonuclease n=1 Tax=Novipirellula sp. SH528 TaxID=3454466 RepID=UPI003F9F773B